MKTPFSVLMLAAIRHPLDYPLVAELVFALIVLTACVVAVAWHHGKRAAHRFNLWVACRHREVREFARQIDEYERRADETAHVRPAQPGHVPQPKRRIPLRRLPLRPEFRNPIKTRKVR